MSQRAEELPFRLVGMIEDEFYEVLYSDDSDQIIESIPSDEDSIVDDDSEGEGEINNNSNELTDLMIVDSEHSEEEVQQEETEDADSDSEMDIPLSHLHKKKNSRKKKKQKEDKPPPDITWDKANLPLQTYTSFTRNSGVHNLHVLDMDDPSPGYLFGLFLTDDLLDNIVFQTNLNYYQRYGEIFKRTDKKEIKTFIGINLLMGLKRLPSYRDFWYTDTDLHDNFVPSLMPVKCFSWLFNVNINCSR
jgi:hypothetical protein